VCASRNPILRAGSENDTRSGQRKRQKESRVEAKIKIKEGREFADLPTRLAMMKVNRSQDHDVWS
jgi:hypothetical protein